MLLQSVLGNLKGKTRGSILVRDWISCEAVLDDALVRQFAHTTGDVNPIHLDELEGKRSRFGQRVVHGMLSASLIPTLFSLALPGAVYLAQELKFDQPVFVGDRVRAMIEVNQIRAIQSEHQDECLLVCHTSVFKSDDTKAIIGKAKVLI
ncbi:hypothetical protein BASA81_004042 [Batrachochytrium salamandrivorans]|nr:hypothetical protein BASA81_004042 [Batrachochytrium salamandrivorans]